MDGSGVAILQNFFSIFLNVHFRPLQFQTSVPISDTQDWGVRYCMFQTGKTHKSGKETFRVFAGFLLLIKNKRELNKQRVYCKNECFC